VFTSAGGRHHLLVSRDAHQSVVAGLIFSAVQPRWIPPRWDAELHLANAPSPAAVEDGWNQYPDAAGALAVSPTPYGPAADHIAIAEICPGGKRAGGCRGGGPPRTGGGLVVERRWTDLGARDEMGRAPVRFFL